MVKNKRRKNIRKRTPKINSIIKLTVYIIAVLLLVDSAITLASNLPFISVVDLVSQIQIIVFTIIAVMQIFGAYWLVKFKLKGYYIAVALSILALIYEILYPASYGWLLLYFLPKDIFIVAYLIIKRMHFN
ncbi:MAG: hypothetical protein PHW96_04200 [Candidatus Nanoarchaeia archaeon]|nr:hypothetical protein [Candidatus Nanoarchaeia archaeon]